MFIDQRHLALNHIRQMLALSFGLDVERPDLSVSVDDDTNIMTISKFEAHVHLKENYIEIDLTTGDVQTSPYVKDIDINIWFEKLARHTC